MVGGGWCGARDVVAVKRNNSISRILSGLASVEGKLEGFQLHPAATIHPTASIWLLRRGGGGRGIEESLPQKGQAFGTLRVEP